MIGLAVLVEQHVLVAHLGIFKERGDGVEAEAGHAALEPEADDVFERLVDLRIVPVEVGLLDVELVVVVLARLLDPTPRRSGRSPTASYWAASPLSVAVSPLPSCHIYQSR